SVALAAMSVGVGCRDNTPPPPQVPVPSAGSGPYVERAAARPVEQPDYSDLQAPTGFNDVPIGTQAAPEQAEFLKAYQDVGRPRITVFVNRTIEGDLIPVNAAEPDLAVQRTQRSTTGVSVERRETTDTRDYYRNERRERIDNFESDGPAEFTDTTEVYLRRGEYDEVAARQIDYLAVENILADQLSAGGQVVLIAP